ncbi:MAG: phage integrase N-terminal SAM-like domain-containing protein [Gemmatimonadales bacterium]
MSRRTEDAYVYWTKRFVRFCGLRHPSELGPAEVRQFLTHLVMERNLSAATQQQALSALLFLYRNVVGRPLEALGPLPRGRVPTTLPVVLSPGGGDAGPGIAPGHPSPGGPAVVWQRAPPDRVPHVTGQGPRFGPG